MEVERAWGREPGWFMRQPHDVRTRLLAWANIQWGEPPKEPGSTKSGADWWTS